MPDPASVRSSLDSALVGKRPVTPVHRPRQDRQRSRPGRKTGDSRQPCPVVRQLLHPDRVTPADQGNESADCGNTILCNLHQITAGTATLTRCPSHAFADAINATPAAARSCSTPAAPPTPRSTPTRSAGPSLSAPRRAPPDRHGHWRRQPVGPGRTNTSGATSATIRGVSAAPPASTPFPPLTGTRPFLHREGRIRLVEMDSTKSRGNHSR